MFVQVVQGKTQDSYHLRRELRRWRAEIKPRAIGYLGSTSGVTADGRAIGLFRFENEAAAVANSERAEQVEWWNLAKTAYDGEAVIHNCVEVDTLLGGGSNWAGFVQIIQGRAKEQVTMRRRLAEMEVQLRASRPDILGGLIAWHGDGNFTQAVYFTSAQAAREAEAAAAENAESSKAYANLIDGQPTFFDLQPPDFD